MVPRPRAQGKRNGEENVLGGDSETSGVFSSQPSTDSENSNAYMNYIDYPCQIFFQVTEILPCVIPYPATGQTTSWKSPAGNQGY